MQNNDNSLEKHQQIIDKRIKEGIDKLIASGSITDDDFYGNADGDKMIAINDDAGDVIIYNYTKQCVYSYAGRLKNK